MEDCFIYLLELEALVARVGVAAAYGPLFSLLHFC